MTLGFYNIQYILVASYFVRLKIWCVFFFPHSLLFVLSLKPCIHTRTHPHFMHTHHFPRSCPSHPAPPATATSPPPRSPHPTSTSPTPRHCCLHASVPCFAQTPRVPPQPGVLPPSPHPAPPCPVSSYTRQTHVPCSPPPTAAQPQSPRHSAAPQMRLPSTADHRTHSRAQSDPPTSPPEPLPITRPFPHYPSTTREPTASTNRPEPTTSLH
jgi:hypothetical protein